MSAIADLVIDQGSTWSQYFQWLDPSGTPYDVSGYSARAMFKRNIDEPAVISLTNSSGISVAADGMFILTIAPEVTDTLNGTYMFDLEVVSPGGVVTRLVQGTVTISPSVTR